MAYTIDILSSAQKQLARIDSQNRDRIYSAIRALANEPRPVGCKKLANRMAWRIRVGSYRIIYEIHDDILLVLIIAIGHRREVYRS